MKSRVLSLSAAIVMAGAATVGCAAGSSAERSTIIVTETAATAVEDTTSVAIDATSGPSVTSVPSTGTPAGATTAATATAAESDTGGSTAETSAAEPMAPTVTVNPLTADCTKVLNPTVLGKIFGQLPAGTGRLLEAANPEREITGRLKCQYGVADDKSTIAVQVILAQFASQQAAEAQMEVTATSERQAGAAESSATVMGHPAKVLIRDGGLLVVGYDTWTLSVVAGSGILTDDQLPDALRSTAEHALGQVILNG